MFSSKSWVQRRFLVELLKKVWMEGIFLDQEQKDQQVQCILSLILVDEGRVIDEGIQKALF